MLSACVELSTEVLFTSLVTSFAIRSRRRSPVHTDKIIRAHLTSNPNEHRNRHDPPHHSRPHESFSITSNSEILARVASATRVESAALTPQDVTTGLLSVTNCGAEP
jgi:hypothetical protein